MNYKNKYLKYKKKYLKQKAGSDTNEKVNLLFVGHGWNLDRTFKDDTNNVFTILSDPTILYESDHIDGREPMNKFTEFTQEIPNMILTTNEKMSSIEHNGLFLVNEDGTKVKLNLGTSIFTLEQLRDIIKNNLKISNFNLKVFTCRSEITEFQLKNLDDNFDHHTTDALANFMSDVPIKTKLGNYTNSTEIINNQRIKRQNEINDDTVKQANFKASNQLWVPPHKRR